MKKVSSIQLVLEAVLEDGSVIKGAARVVPLTGAEEEDCRCFAYCDMASQLPQDINCNDNSFNAFYVRELYHLLKSLPISKSDKLHLNDPKDLMDLCFERLLLKLKD